MKLGIDNGVTGAAVLLTDDGEYIGDYLFKAAKPTRVMGMINIVDFVAWLNASISPIQQVTVLIEEPALNQGPHTTVQSIASTAASFARTLAALELVGVSDILVTPAVCWQKLFWKTSVKSVVKPSIAIAQQLFSRSFIPHGCKVVKDGLTDAALMAYLLTQPELKQRLIEDAVKRREGKERKRVKKRDLNRALKDGGL